MRIIGVDLHTRQQSIAMLNTETGEVIERTLKHDNEELRKFYDAVPRPVRVGIEATGSMYWFLQLMEEQGIECFVGHPTKIRKAETRKQKHDRRDALLLLKLLVENRFPTIWVPSAEQRDLRTLLLHRHQLVRMKCMAQNGLQAIALSNGLRRGHSLWRPSERPFLSSIPSFARSAVCRCTRVPEPVCGDSNDGNLCACFFRALRRGVCLSFQGTKNAAPHRLHEAAISAVETCPESSGPSHKFWDWDPL